MGIIERKEREKAEMREHILDAALKLFITEGFEHISIRKIASAIEFSPGTIYLYFPDKDAIFFELHERGFSEFYKYQLSVQDIADPRKRLEEHGKRYIQFAQDHPELYDIMFIARSPAKKIKELENWEVGDRTYELLKKNIRECQEIGYFPGWHIEVIAFSFWAHVHGIASLFVRGRLVLLPEQVRKMLIEQSFNFLFQYFTTTKPD